MHLHDRSDRGWYRHYFPFRQVDAFSPQLIPTLPTPKNRNWAQKNGLFFSLICLKLCEKKFQIFQIFENEICKLLIINKTKAEPEGFEPSVRF